MRALDERKRRGRRTLRLNRAVFLALAAAVLTIGLASLSAPLSTLRSQQQDLAGLRQRRRALLEQRDLLEAEKRRLATENGQEWAARRRGYVRHGERRLVFSPEAESPSDDRSHELDAQLAPGIQ
jgi:cell division protein FtsB